MQIWQRLNGLFGRATGTRLANTSTAVRERRSEARGKRRRRPAESSGTFFVRRLEDRQVLNADAAATQTFVVAENAVAGTTVGTLQSPAMFDPSQPLTYSIVAGNPSNAFLVLPNSGEVQIANPDGIDYESADRWDLTIGVSQGEGGPTSTIALTVQVTDVYAPATVQLAGGDATLSLVDGRLQVQQGASILFAAPSEDVSSLTILGSSQADSLIVDFSGGNPLPTGGLFYDGGAQPVDTVDALELRGNFEHVAYRYDNGNDGGIVVTQGAVARAIEYRNLEPLVNIGDAAEMEFVLGAANDNVVLEQFSATELRLRSTDAVPTFETTTFTAPTTKLTLRTGDGNDTITIMPLASTFTFTVAIDGGAGDNKLIIDQTDPAATSASQFRFAGFTFDQNDAVNQASQLANGALVDGYGVTITIAGEGVTGAVNFPESASGFNSALTIGRLITSTTGARAWQMPDNNVGTTLRSGVELSWSGGRTLTNSDGDDLLIYESSDSAGGPDAAMIQVHVVGVGWTKWWYEAKDVRGFYTGSTTTGAFVTAIDLTDLGVLDGQTIDKIRYVNMVAADRMEGTGVEKVAGSGVYVSSAGFVKPGDNGATSNVLPDPGSGASFSFFGSATFDPDLLYVGTAHALTGGPAYQNGNDVVDVTADSVTITTDGAATSNPLIEYLNINESLTVRTRGGTDKVNVELSANLLPSIIIDGGNPQQNDEVQLNGTTGDHVISLSGTTATVETAAMTTTISLTGVETLTVDVATGTSPTGDTVTVDGSFRLNGNDPRLSVIGGVGQNDTFEVRTEMPAGSSTDKEFTFAGVTFQQSATPDVFSELRIGDGLGVSELPGGHGVRIDTRIVDTSTTLGTSFPGASATDFNPSLSLGRLFGRSTGAVQFFGMPDSTNNNPSGTANDGKLRSGFVLTWSGDRVLKNDGAGEDLDGDGLFFDDDNDLVIYESGSTGSPEPVIVQVHDVETDTWSPWIYRAASSRQVTTGGSNVAFATVYNLTEFGIAPGGTIDAIRVVNLVVGDRMADSSGEGVVLPAETSPTSTFKPLPGGQSTLADFTTSPSAVYDPDPIYFGVTHSLGGAIASNDVVSIDANSVDVTNFMKMTHANVAHLSVKTGAGADTITVVDSGETVTTAPQRTLSIDAGDGNDTVTFTSIDATALAAITVDGGAGTDVVTINAALTIGSASSTGNVAVTAETINLGQSIDTTAGTVGTITFQGAVNVTSDVTLTTADGDVTFSGATSTVNGDRLLTIVSTGGDVQFDAAIGNTTPLSGLDVTAKTLTVSSTLHADDEDIDVDVTETVIFSNAVTTTNGGTMTVTNGGLMTIADAANLLLDGAFTQDGLGDTELFANITTTNDDVTFERKLTLMDDVTFTTAGGDVEFDGATATIDGEFLLTIIASAGNVTFDGAIGAADIVDGIKITSAATAVFNETVLLRDRGLDVTTTGAVSFAKAVETQFSGTVAIANGGLLTIVDAADFLLDGRFDQTGAGATSLAGDIRTTNDVVEFDGAVTLATKSAGNVFIGTGTTGANITFNSTLNGTTANTEDLQLAAGAGNVRFVGIVGGSTPLGDVLIDSANNVNLDAAFTAKTLTHLNGTGTTTFDGLTTLNTATGTALDLATTNVVVNAEVQSTGGDLNIAVDNLTINLATGSLDATAGGIITIVPDTTGRAIDLGNNTATSLSLSTAELNRITAGVLRIGDGTSGSIDLSAAIAPTSVPILHLITGGNVAGVGTIAIAQLGVETLGSVQLSNANDVDRLGIHVLGAGNHLAFRDVDGVLLADVDGVGGFDTNGGNATLDTGGAVTQDVFGSIVANGLQLLGTGPVTLTNPTNIVNVIAASLTNALSFRNFVDLTVGTVQTFGPATSGITTTDDAVTLRSRESLTLASSIAAGNAIVRLTSDLESITQSGAVVPKVIATNLALSAATGIGTGQPLVVDVDLLAAENFTSGRIAVVEQSGTLLTIGTTGGVTGITNFGEGGVSVQHVGPMTVASAIVDAGGGIALSTSANGGNDDHLSLNAPLGVFGGSGNIVLFGGTDLLFHDAGVLDDVIVTGNGEILGSAGRDVVIDNSVRIRSATGAIENIPPFLQNLSGPQIQNTGNASVTFDYGRLQELNFTATVDWSDGTVDVISLFNPGTTTANHTYAGNPNELDPSAPIPVTVTLQSDSRIRISGYETTTLQTTLEFPGDGVRNVRIDTTAKVPQLTFPPPARVLDLRTTNTTVALRATVDEGSGSAVETTEQTERIVILREVLPDGREGSEVRFSAAVLDDLASLFRKVRDGRYRVYLFEPETQSLRIVVEIYVRGGKPTSAESGNESMRDRPDGADWRPADAMHDSPVAAAAATESIEDEPANSNTAWMPVAAGAAVLASTTNWSERVNAALATYRKSSRLMSQYRRRRNRAR